MTQHTVQQTIEMDTLQPSRIMHMFPLTANTAIVFMFKTWDIQYIDSARL